MSLKPPQVFGVSATGRPDPLAYELMAERADALGRTGRKVEAALAALKAAEEAGDAEGRERMLTEAAHVVWAFVIQREICGFRDQADMVRRYGIPPEVMVRLGTGGADHPSAHQAASGRNFFNRE